MNNQSLAASLVPKIQIVRTRHNAVYTMTEFICPDCGKRLYHENETTLEIEKGVHKKFCTKIPGDTKSFMHRGPNDNDPIDKVRATDNEGKPILKR